MYRNYAKMVVQLSPPKDYPTSQMPVETYDEVLSVNSRCVVLCMRAQLRAMEHQPNGGSSSRMGKPEEVAAACAWLLSRSQATLHQCNRLGGRWRHHVCG